MAATDAAKLSISGQAFAALLDCCGNAVGDCDGLLFGRAVRPPPPPPSFFDDDDAPTSSASTLSISITGHASLAQPSSLSDALGRFHPYSPGRPDAVGFFSSRRSATLLPSMREAAVARSLSKSLPLTQPLVFVLLAPSSSSNLSIHSFDYRAFLLVDSLLVPASLQVVNVGPGFWGQYHTFAAESPMPWMPRPPARGYGLGEKKAMDWMVEGFGPGRLQAMVTSATGHTTEVEELYSGMLRKLDGLARETENSGRCACHQVMRTALQAAWICGAGRRMTRLRMFARYHSQYFNDAYRLIGIQELIAKEKNCRAKISAEILSSASCVQAL